jgi:hypothetical protein
MKVFLSYAREDKDRVLELYQRLIQEGFDAWLDKEKLLPGQDWDLEINRAIKNSDAIILCLTKRSVQKRGYVQREMKKAIDLAQEQPEGEIYVIPVRLDDCKVPDSISNWQYVDLFATDGFQRLKKSLKQKESRLSKAILHEEVEISDSNQKKREVVQDLHTVALEIFERAERALQENQNTLIPLLTGDQTPKEVQRQMLKIFHGQKSRGFFNAKASYLEKKMELIEDVELREILIDLQKNVEKLIDIFYSIKDKNFRTKSAMVRKIALMKNMTNESPHTIEMYLNVLRECVGKIGRTVGALKAIME